MDIPDLQFQLVCCLGLPVEQFEIIDLELFCVFVLHCYTFECELMVDLACKCSDLPVLGGIEDYFMNQLADVKLELDLFRAVYQKRLMF